MVKRNGMYGTQYRVSFVSGGCIYETHADSHVFAEMASGDDRNTLGSCLQLINSNTAHPELFLR